MSANIELITREKQKALVLSDAVGMMKMSQVMGPAYKKIIDYLKEKSIEPLSVPFTSYVIDDWEKTVSMKGLKAFISVFTKKWQIQMGFEVPDETVGSAAIEEIHLLAGKYLETIHIGPYQKVGEAYKKVYSYAMEHQLELAGLCYEYYLNDPGETSKDKLETRILVPLI